VVLTVLVVLLSANVKQVQEEGESLAIGFGVMLDGKLHSLLKIMSETGGSRHDGQLEDKTKEGVRQHANIDGFQTGVQVLELCGDTSGWCVWINGEIHELVPDVHLCCSGNRLEFCFGTLNHCMRRV
jgi:hypothetical protein